MSGESLAFDIFAIDRASEVFKKVADNGMEMGDKFGKIGADGDGQVQPAPSGQPRQDLAVADADVGLAVDGR